MQRYGALWIVLASLLIGLACGGGSGTGATEEAEAAFETLKEEYRATEDPAEKAAIAEEYLTRFPETEHTRSIAETLVYHRGEELGQWEQVYTTLETVLEQVESPATRLEVALALHTAAVELERPIDLAGYVADLEAERPLTYGEHLSVMEAASGDAEWTMLERHASTALELATPEAYRADYPDLEISDAELEIRIARRAGLAQAYEGWALAHTERVAEAIGAYERAAAVTPKGYFEVPDGPLYRFWGQTLVEQGEVERGLELLARATLWADDEAASEALIASYQLEQPFEDWLWDTRLATARQLDDATLTDYDGNEHRLMDHLDRGLMLAFWFPT